MHKHTALTACPSDNAVYPKAGDGNRTHVSSLEGWCSTIELHPQDVIGVTGFEPATSWSQTRRSSQAEPHPVVCSPLAVTQMLLYSLTVYMSTVFLKFCSIFFPAIFIYFIIYNSDNNEPAPPDPAPSGYRRVFFLPGVDRKGCPDSAM